MSSGSKMIVVPYGDFVDGVTAQATLGCIHAVIRGCEFDSEKVGAIKQIIGYVEEEEETKADNHTIQQN